MTVAQFFHVCRSAAAIADVGEVTVFGAAAVIPWMAEVANASRARVFRDPVSAVGVRVPHPLDLLVAKIVRGDPRDWSFAEYVWTHATVSTAEIVAGLEAAGRARPEYAAAARAAQARAEARSWPARVETRPR